METERRKAERLLQTSLSDLRGAIFWKTESVCDSDMMLQNVAGLFFPTFSFFCRLTATENHHIKKQWRIPTINCPEEF